MPIMYLVHIKIVYGVIIAFKMFASQPGMIAYTESLPGIQGQPQLLCEWKLEFH